MNHRTLNQRIEVVEYASGRERRNEKSPRAKSDRPIRDDGKRSGEDAQETATDYPGVKRMVEEKEGD